MRSTRRLAAAVLAAVLVLTAAACAAEPTPEPKARWVAPRTPTPVPTPTGALPASKKPAECKGYVGLTFDDGPTTLTDQYLYVLKFYDAPATFFNIGKYENQLPQQVKRMEKAGHVVGHHTLTHPDMTMLTDAQRAKEFAEPIRIHKMLGHPKYKFWRPPYGATTPDIRREGEALRMTEVLWDTDTKDFDTKDSAKIIERSRGMEDGDIILMHDGKPQTLAALPTIINEYYAQGLCWGVLARTDETRRSDVGVTYAVHAVKPKSEAGKS